MIELRPYQHAAVDGIFRYFGRATGNPLVVMPTGSGKSLVLAAFCKRAIETLPDTRILIATHRAELIEQDARAIRSYWPDADVGIYSAGLGMRQVRKVTVAGVQSIAGVDFDSLPPFDLVMIDEVHLVPKEGDGQYRTLIGKLTALNPALKVIGLTATPYRLNGGKLTRGAGKLFHSICYELPIQQLVDEGYLAPLTTPEIGFGNSFSTTGVATRGGDFAQGDLGKRIEEQVAVTRVALEEMTRLAAARKSILIYCVSREHARQAMEHLFSLGITCHIVTGEDDPFSRKSKIDAFKRGEIRCMVSIDVLTTGFDAPCTDCIVLLRPTQSTGLYVQICGRGMRTSQGKVDCLVLDYGGNIERHGPITAVDPKQAKEAVAAKMKVCPKCDAEIAVYRRECNECGYIFPIVPREIDHEKTASNRSIMAATPPEWIEIPKGFSLSRWDKKPIDGAQPSPPTVVVKYCVDNSYRMDYREWVCPEHGGFAAQKFRRWWLARGGKRPFPSTVEEAIDRQAELLLIEAIAIEKDGKFDRVSQVRFSAAQRKQESTNDAIDNAAELDDVDLVDEIFGKHATQTSFDDDDDGLPF